MKAISESKYHVRRNSTSLNPWFSNQQIFQDSLDTSSQNPNKNSTAEIVPSSEDSLLASDVIVGVVKSMGQVCIEMVKLMCQVCDGVVNSMGQVSIEL